MSNAEVAAKLQRAADGLLMPSESEFPFESVQWQISQQEPITSKKILEFTEHPLDVPVEVVDLDYFFRNVAVEKEWHDEQQKEDVKKYQKLVETIKSNLSDVQVYRVGRINIDVYIVGKTQSGNLAGLSTKLVET
ncbi:nuclease A inhibitor family protein [Fischerella thermalis]|uniref:Nuclease n=1 Tax=Fischerella thermalis CCMEE 5318 TaxID=2019666 RepID=A0A2N6LK05_9CYAN|nr:nuclease A inhibitor family protein [Fischerella thermalis]PMB24979.1 nuclease [Fischerella thermalis CCMEE 5318]